MDTLVKAKHGQCRVLSTTAKMGYSACMMVEMVAWGVQHLPITTAQPQLPRL